MEEGVLWRLVKVKVKVHVKVKRREARKGKNRTKLCEVDRGGRTSERKDGTPPAQATDRLAFDVPGRTTAGT